MNLADLYLPDPLAKGQWWHFVAALKTKDWREFGVQFTVFCFGKFAFTHCAITDVAAQKHIKVEVLANCLPARVGDNLYYIKFDTPLGRVDLAFDTEEPLVEYPSLTSKHFGNARMNVSGHIGKTLMRGVGCFDREIFDRLLLPGERGWTWKVEWFDDGTTGMDYFVIEGAHYRNRIHSGRVVDFQFLVASQQWPRTDHSVGYIEALSGIFENGKRIGTAYVEVVGLDGVPNI